MTSLSMAAAAAAVPVRGAAESPERMQVVFLLAQFPDLPLGRPRHYFTEPAKRSGLVERLVDYYAEVSHGHLVIEPMVAENVVTVAQPQVRYVQKPAVLIRDAFRAFLAVPTDRMVRAGLEAADAIVVFFAGPGKESDLRGVANDPWSNFTGVTPPLETPGGHRIDRGCVIAGEQRERLSSFGVLCHEFGHLLGLPELYAPGGAAHEGIGVWGLMGQGTWLGGGERPPHLSAWSKLAMGWADVELVVESGRVTLPAVDRSGRVVKIWAWGPQQPWAYYLVENRQRRGTDGVMPGSGLLIWRIDERIRGMRTSQSDPDNMRVTLIQADGRDDLRVGHRAGGNRGDAGDAWRGMDSLPRLLLDLGILIGVCMLIGGVFRARQRRRLSLGVTLALGIGLTGLLMGICITRSPTFAPDGAAGGPNAGRAAPTFTISDISSSGDPMAFTVRFDDGDRS